MSTAGTSTQRGPSGRSRTVGSSPGPKVSSRSPSTAMTPDPGDVDDAYISYMRRIPLRRPAHVDEQARVVLFLAS